MSLKNIMATYIMYAKKINESSAIDFVELKCFDGWADDLRFHVLFNSILVISGQWESNNERL